MSGSQIREGRVGWRDVVGVRGCLAGLSVTALVLAASCSAAPPPSPPPTTTVQPPPVTATPPPADQTLPAVEAYRGMWADFAAAGHTSDWQSVALQHHAIGIALTNLARALYADHYNGFITKGQPVLNPVVRSSEPVGQPTKVIVGDCADSTGWLKYDASTGKPVGGGGGRSRITGVVDRQPDGSWKVSDYAVQGLGSC